MEAWLLRSFDEYILISSSAVYPESGIQPFAENAVSSCRRFVQIYGCYPGKQTGKSYFNLGNKEAISIREWVELCYAVVGKTVVFENI